jgi:hypothetical protein
MTNKNEQKNHANSGGKKEYTMADFEKETADMYDELNAMYQKASISDARLLRAIKAVKGNAFHDEMIDYLDEDCHSGYNLVKAPKGKFNDWIQFEHIKVWVDQTCNGGYLGDDYSGFMYIELKPNLYLQAYYSC